VVKWYRILCLCAATASSRKNARRQKLAEISRNCAKSNRWRRTLKVISTGLQKQVGSHLARSSDIIVGAIPGTFNLFIILLTRAIIQNSSLADIRPKFRLKCYHRNRGTNSVKTDGNTCTLLTILTMLTWTWYAKYFTIAYMNDERSASCVQHPRMVCNSVSSASARWNSDLLTVLNAGIVPSLFFEFHHKVRTSKFDTTQNVFYINALKVQSSIRVPCVQTRVRFVQTGCIAVRCVELHPMWIVMTLSFNLLNV